MTILSSTSLAARIAMQARLTPLQAEAAINALGLVILNTLSNGDQAAIDGFGLFQVADRSDGSKGVKFVQTRQVREVLNENKHKT